MSRLGSILAGLLIFLMAEKGLAQSNAPQGDERIPPRERLPEVPSPIEDTGPDAGEAAIEGDPVTLEGPAEAPPVVSLSDFLGYRYGSGSLDWIPGSGDRFGMFSVLWDHYAKSGIEDGIGFGAGFHFLGGPERSEMPARVFDFSIGYQVRDRLGPFGYDLAAAVKASSDFQGSAREGIRFPGHAVGFLSLQPEVEMVFGVDYLDRGDIKLLPVGGVIWMPNPEVRLELVFPRPRAVFQLAERHRLYLAGELGGGTWAVERSTVGDDLATYRDFRASVGIERVEEDGQRSAFEIGYLFSRRLEFSSGIGDMRLDDAVVLRLVTTF